jgi:hypothetical protein
MTLRGLPVGNKPGQQNLTVGFQVTLDGPFFRRDPGKTFRQNVRDMLDVLSGEMEAFVRGEIAGHAGSMPGYSGWTWAHTIGRTENYMGKRWGTWAVVSANTNQMSARDAIRTKAAAATIERRWHPYRKAKSAVYRSRALIRADLTEGIA